MSLLKASTISIACQLALLPGLAQAQSSEFDRAFAPQSAEARIQFSIPLGESQNRSKTKPRLGFAVRNYNQSPNRQLDWMMADENVFNGRGYSETRLGFTLESSPQWMLNDQVLQLPKSDEQANIGTVGKIGIGVAVVAVTLVTVVGVLVLVCVNDRECNSDDG